MRKIFCALLAFSFCAQAEILWKPEDITFEIKQSHELMGIGLILELNQSLDKSETGWKQSRIDIPESWGKAKLEMRQGTIIITVDDQEYYLNATNMGKLSFEILNGGNKADQQLLEIWTMYASNT